MSVAGSRTRSAPAFILVTLAVFAALPGRGLAGPEASPAQPAAAPAQPTEDALLRAACLYLKLSRGQLVHLLVAARSTDRRLALFQQEEARVMRRLEPLAARDPEEIARARHYLDQQREQVVAQIVDAGAAQLLRSFTREQVGLAWRLTGGTPPQYARADPALIQPSAGFVQARRPISDLIQFHQRVRPDGGGGAEAQPQEEAAAAERTVLRLQAIDQQVAALLQAQEAQARGLEGRRERTELQLLGDLIPGMARESRGAPIPQRLAESNDPAEFVPLVQPLARRLFTSRRFLPVLQDALARGLPGAAAPTAPRMDSLRPVRDYRMERGLIDRGRRGPELETLGGFVRNGLYHFGAGQGLRLADTGVTDHYAVDLIFRYLGGGNGYQKVIDFKNGKRDEGLYVYQGHLTFYTLADGGVPLPGRDHRLRLERNRATRIVRAYLDSRAVFAFVDLDDLAVFDQGAGTFFKDDGTTRGEEGPGALTSLIVWGMPGRG